MRERISSISATTGWDRLSQPQKSSGLTSCQAPKKLFLNLPCDEYVDSRGQKFLKTENYIIISCFYLKNPRKECYNMKHNLIWAGGRAV